MKKRPNILFILADDMGGWALGCAGNPEIRTPNLDRLAAQGMRFENFFCVSPVCSPARASLFTGRIPSQHGIHDWIKRGNTNRAGLGGDPAQDHEIDYLQGMPTYTEILRDAGYRCSLSGKWHLGRSEKPQKGFSDWFSVPLGYSHYFNADVFKDGLAYVEPGYLSDAITDAALEYIGQRKEGTPFYVSVHYTAPHDPWDANQHPKAVYDHYLACPFKSCPELPIHPWQMNSAPLGFGSKRKERLAGYFAAMEGMDTGVGRLLQSLEAQGLAEDTVVVFSSDNGMNMGHHGIFGKGNATYPQNVYDSSVKVPMLIRWPGITPQGAVSQELLSHYDFMPTLLELLELKSPDGLGLPGISFAPILRGEKALHRDEVVVFDEYGPVRMIRDHDFKYVQRHPAGPHEFFDLKNDPLETKNLVADPAFATVVEGYRGRLELWFERYTLPEFDGRHQAVYGKGQLRALGWGEGPAFADDWHYLNEDETPR